MRTCTIRFPRRPLRPESCSDLGGPAGQPAGQLAGRLGSRIGRRTGIAIGLALGVSLATPTTVLADALEARGAIDAVTVYRGQALVSRVVELPGASGLREIVVTDLPEFIVPASLYAESRDGVEVRSVRYRMRPVAEDSRDEVRALDQRLRDLGDAIDSVKAKQAYMEWHRGYLERLEGFLTATAQVEAGRGVLNAETVAKMSELIMSQRMKQVEDGRSLALELRGLQEEQNLVKREHNLVSARSSRTAREAVVFVNQTAPGAALRLNYLVTRADWSPSYNLHAPGPGDRDGNEVTVDLEYQASISQMSGEDWPNVAVTLSTATPALVASGPSLQPLVLALVPPVAAKAGIAGELAEGDYAFGRRQVQEMQREVESVRNSADGFAPPAPADDARAGGTFGSPAGGGSGGGGGGFGAAFDGASGADAELNLLADQLQLLDVVTTDVIRRADRATPSSEPSEQQGVSVTYRMDARTSLPSRADQQLVQIARVEAPATFVKVATPLLTQYVYDEATLVNRSELVLLAGPAASYAGGEFVGRGFVPTVAAGESFTTGFGIDTSLRATRELIERTESVQGGNRLIDVTYRLAIENFAGDPVDVRVIDRIPNAKGNDIKLTLTNTGTDTQGNAIALSDDATYLRTQRRDGILRWDTTVPASVHGADAFAFEYAYRLEFDRQMSVTGE